MANKITSKDIDEFFDKRLRKNEDKIRELFERIYTRRLRSSGDLNDMSKDDFRTHLDEAMNRIIGKLYNTKISNHVKPEDLS